MKTYFYSEISCYLKINGSYEGIVSKNYSYLNLSFGDFVEFIPISNAYLPCYQIFNDELFNCFKFYDGYLIIPKFIKLRTLPYKITFQKTYYDKYTITVLTDGNVKFYLNGPITATEELPFLPSTVELYPSNNFIYLIFKGDKIAIFVYSLKGVLSFKNVVNDYTINDNLIVTIKDEKFTPLIYTFTYAESEPFTLINATLLNDCILDKFIPYVFLTNLWSGVSVKDFLSSELKERENDLKDFIGDFSLILPPLTNDYNKILCLHNDTIKHLTFIISNGKITNFFID